MTSQRIAVCITSIIALGLFGGCANTATPQGSPTPASTTTRTDDPATKPSETVADDDISDDEDIEDDNGLEVDEGDDDGPTRELVVSDPSIMKEMSCDPLSPEFLEASKTYVGYPRQSVKIEVGEGLTPGENWSVVALDSPPDDSYEWGIRRFLTTAPGIEDLEEIKDGVGKWIVLDEQDPWANVLWPEDKLVVAQSALEKALTCIDG